jgi:peptidoglycan/LPS O-acetylase OafA/YrhL
MAIGGMAAWLLHSKNERILGIGFDKRLQALVLILAAGIHLSSTDFFGPLQIEVLAVFYAIIIMNAAANPATIVRLERWPLPYLGRISYGIYVYQILGIRISFLIINRLGGFTSPLHRFGSMYALSALLTVGLAALSYHYFEQPFLRRKTRFSAVPTAA